jgi:hypothetical protein
MADNGEHKRMIKGNGAKGKHHNAKLEAFQNLIVLANFVW